MKRNFLIYLACFFFLVFICLANAEENQDENKIDSKVIQEFDNGADRIKVYVELNDNLKKSLSSHNLKKDIANSILSNEIEHDFGDIFAVEISKNDLSALEDNENIKNVRLVGKRQLFLQDSVPLINATLAWKTQANGINLTGTGQTICILDSGVNYTHPDLGGCYGYNNPNSGCKVIGGWDYANGDNDPMDNNGHGTHVSGITAANGTIKGVAPGAKIVMVRVCNDSCWDTDIINGIEWCVNNASTFNISVISMSIGGSVNFTNYCDNETLEDSYLFVSPINAAVAKNISVVIATGNSANSTGIASPSCIQNATPISSTNKSDAISSFSNRNSLVQLFAPGTNINSTRLNSGTCLAGCSCTNNYMICSGTSMATPHAAGAFAIFKQFLTLTGRTKTPQEIETIFYDTGKRFSEGTNNFSRINAYNATLLLKPSIFILSPENTSYNNKTQLVNIANSSDAANIWWYNGSANLTYNGMLYYNFSEGSNTIIAYANDSIGNLNYTSVTFAIDSIMPQIAFSLPTNDSGTILTQDYILVNVTASDTNLANITIRLYNATGLVNSTNSTTPTLYVNFSANADTIYYFNATAYDTFGNYNYTETRNVSVDARTPSLTVNSPVNNSWNNTGKFNVSINENGLCWYSLNGGISNISMSSSNNQIFNATNSTMANGNYNVTYYCNDSQNRLNASSKIFFNIDKNPPSVTLIEPDDDTSYTGTTTVSFQYEVSDNINISQCALVIDDEIKKYNSSAINMSATNSINRSMSEGNYDWTINCTDIAGNSDQPGTNSLTIESEDGGDGGDGGGADLGLTGTIYSVSQTAFSSSQGYTKALARNEGLRVAVEGANHTLKIEKITTSSVTMIITSNPINLTLSVGESRKLNLSTNNFYDFYVKLESIASSKANITIKSIYEMIPASTAGAQNGTAGANMSAYGANETGLEATQQKSSTKKIIVIILLIAFAAIAGFLIYNLVKMRRGASNIQYANIRTNT